MQTLQNMRKKSEKFFKKKRKSRMDPLRRVPYTRLSYLFLLAFFLKSEGEAGAVGAAESVAEEVGAVDAELSELEAETGGEV